MANFSNLDYNKFAQRIDYLKFETELVTIRYKPSAPPTRLTKMPTLMSLLGMKPRRASTSPPKSNKSTPSASPTQTDKFHVFWPTFRAILAQRGILPVAKLGSGGYSDVHLCARVSPQLELPSQPKLEKVAVKVIDRRKSCSEYQTRFLARELSNWSMLRHPNIVQLLEFFSDPVPAPLSRFVFMISEYADGGDCLAFMRSVGALDEASARRWIRQVCDGVAYMHSMSVAHRDLKLENLFLDAKGNIKIGDLGFSSRRQVHLSDTFCGSRAYASPEILMGIPHDPMKADVWAIGCIAYIILTGHMPFNEHQLNRYIIEEQRKVNFAARYWGRCTKTCENFIQLAFKFNFSERPNVFELLYHDWLMPTSSCDGATSTTPTGVYRDSAQLLCPPVSVSSSFSDATSSMKMKTDKPAMLANINNNLTAPNYHDAHVLRAESSNHNVLFSM